MQGVYAKTIEHMNASSDYPELQLTFLGELVLTADAC